MSSAERISPHEDLGYINPDTYSPAETFHDARRPAKLRQIGNVAKKATRYGNGEYAGERDIGIDADDSQLLDSESEKRLHDNYKLISMRLGRQRVLKIRLRELDGILNSSDADLEIMKLRKKGQIKDV